MSERGMSWATPIIIDCDDELQPSATDAVRGDGTLSSPSPRKSLARKDRELSNTGLEAERGRGDSRTDLDLEQLHNIEKSVREAYDQMTEAHSAFVKMSLVDARQEQARAQKSLPKFHDEIDPFAGRQHIRTHGGCTLQISHTLGGIGQAGKSRVSVSFISITSRKTRTPSYTHYTEIPRNILVPEAASLEYIPYFGDEDSEGERRKMEWQKGFRALFRRDKDPLVSRKREIAEQVQPYLCETMHQLAISPIEILQLLAGISDSRRSAMTRAFLAAFENKFNISLGRLTPHLRWQKLVSSTPDASTTPEGAASSHTHLSTYVELACVICGAHECGIHGEYETDEDDEEPTGSTTYMGCSMSYQSMMLRHEERAASNQRHDVPHTDTWSRSIGNTVQNEDICTETCARNPAYQIADDIYPPWIPEDVTYLQTMFSALSSDVRATCILGPVFHKTCRDVSDQIKRSCTAPSSMPQSIFMLPKAHALPESWYNNRTKRIRYNIDWGDYTLTQDHAQRPQPRGCSHPGLACASAGHECSCQEANILCEPRLCECPPSCHMRFTGCACGLSALQACSDRYKCPCRALNRECDPDLCLSCCAAEARDPQQGHSQQKLAKLCRNVALQRGVAKQLGLGESTVAGIGFGAFVMEPVAKHDFIAEYVGEVINRNEAEARGCIYDQKKASFIFSLSRDYEIDATLYGNLTRFINHSQDGANVIPQVLLVNGEHRIGFFASRQLHTGEELWFNYGEHFQKQIALIEPDFTESGEESRKRRRSNPAKECTVLDPIEQEQDSEYEEDRNAQADRRNKRFRYDTRSP
ncbi:MAG: hypothetical protein M1818_002907 [Claussenomyces sp. TS43310]|nr:MAG: hypothetical protein M1818_002907 [Claussenomyces sp. TS43310]